MKQYVCTGECGGIADEPGVCKDESCSKKGQPLEEQEVSEEETDE